MVNTGSTQGTCVPVGDTAICNERLEEDYNTNDGKSAEEDDDTNDSDRESTEEDGNITECTDRVTHSVIFKCIGATKILVPRRY